MLEGKSYRIKKKKKGMSKKFTFIKCTIDAGILGEVYDSACKTNF